MRLNLIFRRRYPSAFSIERLFDQLAGVLADKGVPVQRIELPEYNNTLPAVIRNTKWVKQRLEPEGPKQGEIHHVTGDVTSVIFALKRPTVITFHDCNPLLRYPKYHPRHLFYRWIIYELPGRLADVVTVISEKTKSELARLTSLPAAKLEVIPNFVDPAFSFQPSAFNATYPMILQVGTTPNKNIARLAAALADIPCRLEIVGEPEPTDRQALEDHAIDYHYAKGVSDEGVRELYRSCDLLAFASTYEGFGLPILEAQVTGRPVVTSDLSPHREVAGPGGAILVDPFDVSSIRAGILSVIQNSEIREQLVAKGHANAGKYQIEAVAQQYLDVYKRIQ